MALLEIKISLALHNNFTREKEKKDRDGGGEGERRTEKEITGPDSNIGLANGGSFVCERNSAEWHGAYMNQNRVSIEKINLARDLYSSVKLCSA